MPTIAELQIKVDSSPVVESTKALDNFAIAAERASGATDKKRVADDKLATAATKTSTEVDTATKAAERQNLEFEKLLGKIDPITKKLNDLARQEAALFANKENMSTGAFDLYNAKLQESFDKLMGVNTAQKKVSEDSAGVPDRLQKIAEAAYNNAQAQTTLKDAYRGASEAEQGLVSSGAVEAANKRAKAALDEHNAKRQLAVSTKDAAEAEHLQAKSLEDLLSKIDPAVRKLNELDDLQEQLSQKRKLGIIDTETFDRYSATLDRNRESLARYSDGLMNTGKTAKETAFAMRGLPAQFTDIIVSLQGGQAPLTVLLQQGGQIKDMFGGIVPALKAMGTALIAMINPVTITGAALGALAIAAYSGSNELTAFNRAAIQSAGYAGVSAAKFTQLQDSLGEMGFRAGKAAEAMTLLAAGGEVTGELFTKVSQSAILMEKATGQAMSKTIDDFNALGKDPVAAAVRLDEKYRFLTASVLAQAAALERNGQDSEAAALLQEKLADATSKTAQEMIDKAGYIEKAWNGVKGAVQGVWDAMKGVGREGDENAMQLKASQELLERTTKRLREGNLLSSGMTDEEISKNPAVKMIKAQIDGYQKLVTASEEAAKKQAAQEDARRDAVSAQASSAKRYESNLKGVAKAEDELRKVRLENSKIRAGGEEITSTQNEMMVKNEARALEELTKAKEKANKPKSSALDTREVSEVRNNLTQLTAEYEAHYKKVTALGAANIVSAEATYQSQKAILEAEKNAVADAYDKQIEAIKNLRDNKKNSAAQNINLDNQLSRAEAARVAALEKLDARQEVLATKEQGRIQTRERNISSYKSALEAQIQNLEEEGRRAADGVGKGSRQAGIDQKLGSLDRTFERQQRELSKSLSDGMDPAEYTAKLQDLEDAHTKMTEQIIKNDADIQTANGNWLNGFTAAIQNASDEGRNFAKTTEQMVSGAFNSMGDALGQFATTGKINFRSLTASILADMAKIAAKQAASAALSSLFGMAMSAFGGWMSGGAGALGSAATSGASAGATNFGSGISPNVGPTVMFPQAKGGGWDGGTQFFANGGAFTNSIVSSPTSFAMSGGKQGVMGEAGPEAIVPLARASDGSLGVRMVGGDQGSKGGVQVYVTITNEGSQTETSDQGYAGFGKEIGNLVESKYRELQAKDLAAGGELRRAINERG